MQRFVSIILSPGQIWTEHAVIDLKRGTRIATCSQSMDADAIARILNEHYKERIMELKEDN